MESMDLKAFQGKTVWLSGHTGFKGSWLSELLLFFEARVVGYSLPPQTELSLFEQLGLDKRLESGVGNINDAASLEKSFLEAKPDFVFHLAAQPLVITSYQIPEETFRTNVLGTVNILETLRKLQNPCTAICVTSDKCYRNLETGMAYSEDDPLGGHDPYSASKAAAEIVTASYRDSFFSDDKNGIRLASVRAGNVIGGGDWSQNRIVPDAMRALCKNEIIQVRNPHAIRPWQHVLEPLTGYLLLALRLAQQKVEDKKSLAGAYNFGPNPESHRNVGEVVEEILRHWPGSWTHTPIQEANHEAGCLRLNHDKATRLLGWHPHWDFSTTIQKTVEAYKTMLTSPQNLRQLIRYQIEDYYHASR